MMIIEEGIEVENVIDTNEGIEVEKEIIEDMIEIKIENRGVDMNDLDPDRVHRHQR